MNRVPSPYRPPSPLKSTVSLSTPSTKTMRPKAQVNSSATPASARAKVTRPLSAVAAIGNRPPASAIPRPASPTKKYTNHSPVPSTHKPRIARTDVRPQSSHSTPGTPTSTYLSIEIPESENKTKYGGSLSARQTSPPLGLGLSNGTLGSNSIFSPPSDEHADLPPKIKSKLSRVALSGSESLSPSPSPSHPSSHSSYARVRAPSISSNHSLGSNTTNSSTKPEYTPITSPNYVANPHRYTPNRFVEPSSSSHTYQSFSSPSLQDDTTVQYSRIVPKVDPAKIPLPTHSPPTSALSFSSRSSASRSSVSRSESANSSTSVSTNHVKSPSGGIDLRSTLDSLVQISESTPGPGDDLLSPIDDDDIESDDRKARNQAKVNRKIADLEITNRSLLAINSTLEATKHRQAKEIRELRRKLRESRLILPPRTYRAVTSSDTKALLLQTEEEEDEDEDEEEEEDDDEGAAGEDQTYLRIRIRLDEMIQSGQKALTAKPADLAEFKGPTKVLNEQEVRAWRGSEDVGDVLIVLEGDEDERKEVPSSTWRSRLPFRETGGQDNDFDDITSEDEVEVMTMLRDSPSPPIVVTSST
ncbi:hypothetical protein J3R30DRAFT_3697144 [Lentinula aciculospora]|uniref:Uncharacterized protein n=1 Tax=Lentinula aciculospora TaxID=153920 RepID=A0A9W9DTG9_9AGAR|nr:hypothetical protein J3R30DRAFT_3697144 [Lentinula aciculospora]